MTNNTKPDPYMELLAEWLRDGVFQQIHDHMERVKHDKARGITDGAAAGAEQLSGGDCNAERTQGGTISDDAGANGATEQSSG